MNIRAIVCIDLVPIKGPLSQTERERLTKFGILLKLKENVILAYPKISRGISFKLEEKTLFFCQSNNSYKIPILALMWY